MTYEWQRYISPMVARDYRPHPVVMCFNPEGDLVAMDSVPPSRPPCVIEVNSRGQVTREIWRM